MIRLVEAGIKVASGLPRGTRVVLALSGGADSTALLHVLARLAPRKGWALEVAHLHHGLRGKAADADQAFCRELAHELGRPFHTRRVDVRRKAKRSGVSLEMASRSSRYDFLSGLVQKEGGVVVTAHTMDDQAETLLLRLARGVSPRGLRGVLPRTTWKGVAVLRPMLQLRHQQAVGYLEKHRLAWREDLSNRDDAFLRNRVRHELLPLLASRLNPGVTEALARLAEQVREEEVWLDGVTDEAAASCRSGPDSFSAERLRALPVALQRRVLREWLVGPGVASSAVTSESLAAAVRLCSRSSGAGEVSFGAGGLALYRSYDQVSLREKELDRGDLSFRTRLALPGETVLPGPGLRVVMGWGTGYGEPAPGVGLPAEAWLARAPLGRAGLYLRNAQPGDRMQPLGMRGQRKLQDLFTDLKIPADERWSRPVLVCREQVIWVPGYTIDHRWRVRNASAPSLHIQLMAARLVPEGGR